MKNRKYIIILALLLILTSCEKNSQGEDVEENFEIEENIEIAEEKEENESKLKVFPLQVLGSEDIVRDESKDLDFTEKLENKNEINLLEIEPEKTIKLPTEEKGEFIIKDIEIENLQSLEFKGALLDYSIDQNLVYINDGENGGQVPYNIKILNLETDETNEVDLDKEYFLGGESIIKDGVMHYIGNALNGDVFLIKVSKDGKLEKLKLTNGYDGFTEYGENGFLITLKNSKDEYLYSKIFKLYFDGEFSDVVSLEGKYKDLVTYEMESGGEFTNILELDGNIGFQVNYGDSIENYIWDVENGEFIKIENIDSLLLYITGDENLIFTMEIPDYDTEGAENKFNLFTYIKKDGEYEKYRIPMYEDSTYIYEFRKLNEGKYLLNTYNGLNIVDIENLEIYNLDMGDDGYHLPKYRFPKLENGIISYVDMPTYKNFTIYYGNIK